MDHAAVQEWLDRYIAAWETYDPDAIGALFAEDVTYGYHPGDDPVVGRAAVVASWYYQHPGGPVERVYDNCFVMRFDDQGHCRSFVEYYHRRG